MAKLQLGTLRPELEAEIRDFGLWPASVVGPLEQTVAAVYDRRP
jgi:hypothetical protein